MNKNEQQTNWIFLPVHKTRILRELDRATLFVVDYDTSTILPKVFRRAKETKDFVYYSLPKDFKANIRVSHKDGMKYVHKDIAIDVESLVNEYGLDKPYKDVETEIEESVGESVEPVDEE